MPIPNPTLATPLDLVIFGGAGDLSLRKLLPALYMAHLHNNLPAQSRIHALGRQPWDRTGFLAFIQEKVPGFIEHKAFSETTWQSFLERLNYVSLDATQAQDYATLGAALLPGSDRVYYLAT
ncbi:MAG: glucose-6-phosphate dehydrogenase, partial [Polaromonas sp.]